MIKFCFIPQYFADVSRSHPYAREIERGVPRRFRGQHFRIGCQQRLYQGISYSTNFSLSFVFIRDKAYLE